jgi:SNF2 family DNA or RNA helicase
MLSPIFIGRPLDNEFAAKLNGLDCTRLCFDLDDFDAKLVDTFVARYKEEIARLARKGQGSHDQRRRSDGASNAAMGWASKARCAAAHPLLLAVLPKPKKQKDAESKGDNSRKRISLKAYGTCDEDVDDQERPYWLKLIKEDRYLEQHSARIRVAVVAFKWFRHRYPEEKIGICSVSLKLLDILAEVLKRQFEIDAVRFDGLTTPVKRKLTLRKFDESPPAVPMLITAAAGKYQQSVRSMDISNDTKGAFGLNLVNISCLIQLEPWWNINNEQQFISRAYRLGQTKKVKYVRLDAQNSEIDVLTTQVQLKKKTVNDRLMAPLIRRHDAEPVISNLYI